jgi:hypothetical protein
MHAIMLHIPPKSSLTDLVSGVSGFQLLAHIFAPSLITLPYSR